MSAFDDAVATFERCRPMLAGIAYRMTGSATDAEDVCQEAYLRWSGVDHASIERPEAFLTRVVTRLALDRLDSAVRRRETYVGPYLPEPVITAPTETTPEAAAELADSLTFSFLVLLDELGPHERAALLLHDVFGFSFEECARAMDESPAAARQQASRARRRLADARSRHHARRRQSVSSEQLAELLAAVSTGDIDQVMSALAPDVVMISDGGPQRRAARHPVYGPDRVARFMINIAHRHPEYTPEMAVVNGQPAVLLREHGVPDSILLADVDDDGRVVTVWIQRNPDKLRHLASVITPP